MGMFWSDDLTMVATDPHNTIETAEKRYDLFRPTVLFLEFIPWGVFLMTAFSQFSPRFLDPKYSYENRLWFLRLS